MKLFNKKTLTLAVVSVLTSGTAMMAGTLQANESELDLPPPPPGPYATVQAGQGNVQNLMGSSVEMKVSEETVVKTEAAPEAEMVKVPVTQPVLTAATAVPAKPVAEAEQTQAPAEPEAPADAVQAEAPAEPEAPTDAPAQVAETAPVQQPGLPAQAQMMYAPQQMPQMPMQPMPGYGYPMMGNQQMPMMYPPRYMPMPRMQYIYVVPVMPRMQPPPMTAEQQQQFQEMMQAQQEQMRQMMMGQQQSQDGQPDVQPEKAE